MARQTSAVHVNRLLYKHTCMFICISGEIRKRLGAMLASTEGKAESLAFHCLPIGSLAYWILYFYSNKVRIFFKN